MPDEIESDTETESEDDAADADDDEQNEFLNVSKLFVLVRHQYAVSILMNEFFRYLTFITFFAVIVLMQRNASFSSEMRSAIYNKFLYANWRASDTQELLGWLDVGNFGDFWDWHTGPFLDIFYVDKYDNSRPAGSMDRQIVQTHINFVGGMRMVQRRARNGTCKTVSAFDTFDSTCFFGVTPNGLFGNIDRSDFVGSLNKTTYKFDVISQSLLAWEEGYYQYFPGAGGRSETEAKMQDLIADRWLDERATVFARSDIVAYNPNLGMLAQVVFTLLLTWTGQARPMVEIHTLRLSEYANDSDYARLVVELVFLAIFIRLVLIRAQSIWVLLHQARMPTGLVFLNLWEIYDWVQLVLVLGLIALRFYVIFNPDLKDLRIAGRDITQSNGKRMDLGLSAACSDGYFTMCGIFMGISAVKFYRFLRINPNLSVLTQTVVELQSALLNFVMLIVVINFLWACAGIVLFGDQTEAFSDLGKAWEFCSLSFLALLGRSDLFEPLGTNELHDAPVGAYLFFYPFNFVMVFVALNITVSLIMEAYERVLAHVEFLEGKSVISVLSKVLLTEQLRRAGENFWVRLTAVFSKANIDKLEAELSPEVEVEIAGTLLRRFDHAYHKTQVSEKILLRAIAARPELGFYELYTQVGAGVEQEDPDIIIRVSEVKQAMLSMSQVKGIPYKTLREWWGKLESICDDPSTRVTAKERENDLKDAKALASLVSMCRRAAQVRDDLVVMSRKVAAVVEVYVPRPVDPSNASASASSQAAAAAH